MSPLSHILKIAKWINFQISFYMKENVYYQYVMVFFITGISTGFYDFMLALRGKREREREILDKTF